MKINLTILETQMRKFLLVAVFLLPLSVGCENQVSQPSTPVDEKPLAETPVDETPETIGEVALHALEELDKGESFPFSFAATDVDGSEQSLDALKGKVVIVDIWGTWCPPCRAEIPSFIKLQEEFGNEGFQMIGVNYEGKDTEEENRKLVTDYITKHGINYPCVLGDETIKGQIPDFSGYPTTIFIDRAGKVRLKAIGLHPYEYLDAVVAKLLAE